MPLIKQKRKSKYISKLSAMGRDLGDFEKVTRAQLRKYIEKIEASEMQPWTKRDYKLIAKKFFKWLNNTDFVEWIRLGRIKSVVTSEDILKEDELSRLREACSVQVRSTLRDKALVETLYETACRPMSF